MQAMKTAVTRYISVKSNPVINKSLGHLYYYYNTLHFLTSNFSYIVLRF